MTTIVFTSVGFFLACQVWPQLGIANAETLLQFSRLQRRHSEALRAAYQTYLTTFRENKCIHRQTSK